MKFTFRAWKDFCLTLFGGGALLFASSTWAATGPISAQRHLQAELPSANTAIDEISQCPYGGCSWYEAGYGPDEERIETIATDGIEACHPANGDVDAPYDTETGKVHGYEDDVAEVDAAADEYASEDYDYEYDEYHAYDYDSGYDYEAEYEGEYVENEDVDYAPDYSYEDYDEEATADATADDFDYDQAYGYDPIDEAAYDDATYDEESYWTTEYDAQAANALADQAEADAPLPAEPVAESEDWGHCQAETCFGDTLASQPEVDLTPAVEALLERIAQANPAAPLSACSDWITLRVQDQLATWQASEWLNTLIERGQALADAARESAAQELAKADASIHDSEVAYEYEYDEYDQAEYEYDEYGYGYDDFDYEDYGYGQYSAEYGYSDYEVEIESNEPATSAEAAPAGREVLLEMACALNSAGEALQGWSQKLVDLAEQDAASHYEARNNK